MTWTVREYEETPNPNALKCWLNRPISDQPRSFLNAAMAADDPIARALFAEAGVVCILMNGDWMTVNKPPEADWRAIKKKVQDVLSRAGD